MCRRTALFKGFYCGKLEPSVPTKYSPKEQLEEKEEKQKIVFPLTVQYFFVKLSSAQNQAYTERHKNLHKDKKD